MNNQQFRRLVQQSSSTPRDGASNPSNLAGTPGGSSLGSRARSSIPMTPRTVKGGGGSLDFARQLAERNAESQPQKKFRSSAAPKGTKFADGYMDRAQERQANEKEDGVDGGDDRAKRIKALEETMKLGQIDRETFEKLRDEITGGDISATHLVKGLDRRLLERVRRGENVYSDAPSKARDEPTPDIDEEFEKLEQRDVVPVTKEERVKRGEMAPPKPVAGVKRSRAEILAEMKAQRKSAAEAKAATQPQLGTRFRKIGEKREQSRIEVDSKGREVLIVVDEDGHEKRKVRKIKQDEHSAGPKELLVPDKDAIPLGMDIPDLPASKPEEEQNDDIFEDAGSDYNPLGTIEDEDDSSDSDSEKADGARLEEKTTTAKSETQVRTKSTHPEESAPTKPAATPRNYFKDTLSQQIENQSQKPLEDATIRAAIQRAARKGSMEDGTSTGDASAEGARRKRHAEMLANRDRDLEDMDMGFGGGGLGDDDDANDRPVKLSEWRGTADNSDGDGPQERGGKQRKRGPKKRKGDKNNAADVLSAMERNKKK